MVDDSVGRDDCVEAQDRHDDGFALVAHELRIVQLLDLTGDARVHGHGSGARPPGRVARVERTVDGRHVVVELVVVVALEDELVASGTRGLFQGDGHDEEAVGARLHAPDPDLDGLHVAVGSTGLCGGTDRDVALRRLEPVLIDPSIGPDGGVNEHWFKAAESDVAVGAAAQPGGSDRDVQPVQIGIRGMEPRTNCFLVVSIPLEQAPRSGRHQLVLQCDDYNEFDDDVPPVYRSLHSGDTAGRSRAATMSMDAGVSGQVKKLDDSKLVRDESEPIVVTILCFNTVVAPDRVVYQEAEASVTNEDLASAIEDIERIYALGDTQCKLSQLPSMLHPTF